jgi:hypothetical protein
VWFLTDRDDIRLRAVSGAMRRRMKAAAIVKATRGRLAFLNGGKSWG